MEIDRESLIPIAHQILEWLQGQIERGELGPGDRLPTEVELCATLGVSRTPVRRAFGELTARGQVVRQAGRGTFVSASPPAARRAGTDEVSITVPDDRWCRPLQQAAALWNEAHPEQPVRLRFRIVGLDDLHTKVALAVAQGDATDISLVDSVRVAEFAERGYIRSLDTIEPELAAALAADLFPTVLRENSVRGELYALQAEADLSLLWYRRDWFAAEALTPPRTWAEWIACARHLCQRAIRDRYRLGSHPLTFTGGVAAGETTTYQLLPLLWSAGADVIAGNEVVLASAEAVTAVAFVGDLVRKHRVASADVVAAPWNGPALALASGTVAMALGGSYERTLIRAAAGWDEDECRATLGFVPIPAGVGGEPATLIGGLSFAINRQSRRPELALALLALATSAPVLRAFCLETGQNPPTISGARALEAEDEPFLQATAPLLTNARARWPIVEYARVSHQLARMFERVILGELDAEQAVARAAMVIAGITGLPERSGPRFSRQALRRSVATTPPQVGATSSSSTKSRR